jgi:hypothetical protein
MVYYLFYRVNVSTTRRVVDKRIFQAYFKFEIVYLFNKDYHFIQEGYKALSNANQSKQDHLICVHCHNTPLYLWLDIGGPFN